MKKMFKTMCILFFCVALLGCTITETIDEIQSERPTIDEGKYDSILVLPSGNMYDESKKEYSLDQIDERADVIVSGYLLDDATLIADYAQGTRIVKTGFMVSSLVITNVFKGNLKTGEQVALAEPWFIEDYSGEDIIYYNGNYFPSIPGKEYIFFLYVKNGGIADGLYSPIEDEYGRYAVIEQKNIKQNGFLTHKTLSLGEKDIARYLDYYTQVGKKYGSLNP